MRTEEISTIEPARRGGHVDVAIVLGIVFAVFGGLYAYLAVPLAAPSRDLYPYWQASRGIIHGHTAIYATLGYVYGPLVAWLFIPLGFLPFQVARVLFILVNDAMIAWMGFVIARWVGARTSRTAWLVIALVLVNSLNMHLNVLLGQLQIGVLALTMLSLLWLEEGRDVAAGVALGLAIAVKPIPALLLPWLLWRRPKSGLVAGGIGAALTLVSGLALGWGNFKPFFTQVLPFVAKGTKDPTLGLPSLTYINASLLGLVRRLVGTHSAGDVLVAVVSVLLIVATVLVLVRSRGHDLLMEAGALLALTAIVSPVTRNIYGIFLIPGLCAIIRRIAPMRGRERRRWLVWSVLAVYVASGLHDWWRLHPKIPHNVRVLLYSRVLYASLMILAMTFVWLWRRDTEPVFLPASGEGVSG